MEEKRERKRVSDLITQEEIVKWNPGDVVVIRAGTGAGKSYFIKNSLYEYAKERGEKILFLLHRDNAINQFQKELDRDDKNGVIDIRTYQGLETRKLYGKRQDISKYSYIVVDECHYFISDAAFNNKTDLSFETILAQNSAVRIFMSATVDEMRDYIRIVRDVEPITYELPDDYSYIKKLVFFSQDDMLDEIARQSLDHNEKTAFFINNTSKAYDLHRRFKNASVFNCAKGNGLYKHVDVNAIDNMLANERFDPPLLVTTSALDTGANLVDTNLRNIVIDMRDIDVIVQSLGRKRVQSEHDGVNLYIKNISNQQLGGYESSSNKKLKMARYLKGHTAEQLIKKYPRQKDASGVIYDDIENGKLVKKINELMFLKKTHDVELYKSMKQLGNFGFCKYLARRFGFYNEETKQYGYEFIYDDFGMESYLERMVGKVMLGNSDRKEFIDKVNVRLGGHRLKGKDAINSGFVERNLPYRVEEFQTSRMVDGKKKNYAHAWRVLRDDEREERTS